MLYSFYNLLVCFKFRFLFLQENDFNYEMDMKYKSHNIIEKILDFLSYAKRPQIKCGSQLNLFSNYTLLTL